MAFYGHTFIFDEIPSEFYNLYLGEFNGSGDATTAASSDVSLLTQKLFRRPVPLLWGTEQTPVLQFPLSVYSTAEITAESFSEISGWLFGQQTCKKLRICQHDMTDIYYNAFLTAPQIIREGNIIYGFTCTVICDAPWGWHEPRYHEYAYNPYEYSIADNIYFLNASENAFYTYPTSLIITANLFGGQVSIVNVTDASRTLLIAPLLPNEVITINNDLQLMSSTLVTYPLYKLSNLIFLRLVRGTNNLVVTGNIAKFSIEYTLAAKIGG